VLSMNLSAVLLYLKKYTMELPILAQARSQSTLGAARQSEQCGNLFKSLHTLLVDANR
jgi:hypothetical protein